jgi:serine/threonine protein kinase
MLGMITPHEETLYSNDAPEGDYEKKANRRYRPDRSSETPVVFRYIPSVHPDNPGVNWPPGNPIVYFVRDIALYLQDHPGFLRLHGWNVDASTGELILITYPIQRCHIPQKREFFVIYGIARTMQWLHATNIIHGHLTLESISIEHGPDSDPFPHLGCLNWSSGRYGLDVRDEFLSTEGDVYDFGVICFSLLSTFPEDIVTFLERIVCSDAQVRPTFDEIVDFLEKRFSDNPDFISYRRYFDSHEQPLEEYLVPKIDPGCLRSLEDAISGLPFIDQCARVLTFFVTPDAPVTIEPLPQFLASLHSSSHLDPESNVLCPDSSHSPSIFCAKVNISPVIQTTIDPRGPATKDTYVGHGTYATVHRRKFAEGEKAVKEIQGWWRRDTFNPPETQRELIVSFLREVLCLMHCAHPAVLRIVGWNITPRAFFVVTERLAPHPVDPTKLDVTERMIIAYGTARGMAHLHSRGVIHRDLKPENVFVDGNGYPTVGDLGWAKNPEQEDGDSGRRSTELYTAPELFENDRKADMSVDVYSFGILLWELISGARYSDQIPNDSLRGNFENALKRGRRPRPVEDLKPSHRELLQKCWSPNGRERPTFEAIVRELEKPENYFEGADLRKFQTYVDWLNDAPVPVVDDEIGKLLQRGTQMRPFQRWLDKLVRAAPRSERIARAFGVLTMRGGKLNEHMIVVVRYILGTRGVFEREHFESLISEVGRFAARGERFPLGRYLFDLTNDIRPDFQVDRVDVTSSRDRLFECIKNVLSLICGSHPCVLKLEGWNIERQGDRLEFVTVTSGAAFLKEDEITGWDTLTREKFVIGIASAVSHLHSLCIFHDNFSLSSVLVDRETSGPRIGGFGLSSTNAAFRYEVDSRRCGLVFNQILPVNHLWCSQSDNLKLPEPEKRVSLEEFVSRCLTNTTEPIRHYEQILREKSDYECPFDLLLPLSGSQDKWTLHGGEVDIATALLELMPGLDPSSEADFRQRVDNSLDQSGTLSRDVLADF